MTRLRTENIKRIPRDLRAYDRKLLAGTGKNLKGIALHALNLPDRELEEMVKSYKVCIIPMTFGQGIIDGFSDAVSGIISHLGFHSFVTLNSDVAGIVEAFEKKADIIFLADDNHFVAINVHTKYVSDNSKMTAKGFVAGLDLMANGLKGKNALVIGCGSVGGHAAKILVKMGVSVSVCDINPQTASILQKEIADVLNTAVQIDDRWYSTPGKYRYIIDATPAADFIDASMVAPDAYVAVPGVPCGLSPDAKKMLSDRYLHDPLQIGVAVMLIDACKPWHVREYNEFRKKRQNAPQQVLS